MCKEIWINVLLRYALYLLSTYFVRYSILPFCFLSLPLNSTSLPDFLAKASDASIVINKNAVNNIHNLNKSDIVFQFQFFLYHVNLDRKYALICNGKQIHIVYVTVE